ncbi:hypothetical protein RND81_08G106100 [Saponaria officinalis]|uniref:protein-serine/threonine phosphatase n=1 Tax=Saponaria officinalis TaxID=3572 RepID=A0AAW1J7L7_SAPOF
MSKPPTIGHGLISVIGRRRSMQDAFTVFPNLVHLRSNGEETSYDFFAVFDGHGSRKVSNKCKQRLHHLVAEELTRDVGKVVEWQSVMATCFARMDAEVAEAEGDTGSLAKVTVGSTALVMVVISEEEIVVANFGDCKVVLFRDNSALQLSHDHMPERHDDRERMEGAGVTVSGLISGSLSTSTPIVNLEPEVEVCKRNATDDFLVIGTNGLWDVMPNDMACELVRKCFSGQVSKTVLEGVGGNSSAAATTMLALLAIARGSPDNISVIVVQLRSFDAESSSFTT